MKKIRVIAEFKRDLKRVKKRGKKLEKLNYVLSKLLREEALDARYRDHRLQGNYKGKRECHIEPDWLLIYEDESEYLTLYRTGTHSDLFE